MTSSPPSPLTTESLILQLHDISAVTSSSTTTTSPFHIDLRHVISHPSLLRKICQTLISQTLTTTSFDLLAALPHSSLPLATCLSTSLDAPMLVPRAANTFDGVFTAGQTCLVVDNFVTSGDEVIEAALAARAAGMKVVDAVAVVDGEIGGRERLAEEGIELHAMVKVSEVVRILKENGRVSEEVERAVAEFLRENHNRREVVDADVVEAADALLDVGDKEIEFREIVLNDGLGYEFCKAGDALRYFLLHKVESHGDGCYTILFPERSNLEDEHNMEYSNHGDQSSQLAQKARSTTKKSQRGGNFMIEEDILLVSAWLNISLDPVQGNEQKHKTYWLRVWEYFHEHKNFKSERNQNSLMNRWSTIQIATNKFCACFAQIESKHHTGVPAKDQVTRAKMKYRELYGSSFQFEHCWNELRDQPKWLEDSKKKKPRRNRSATPHTSSPSTPDMINVGDVDASHDTILDAERPPSYKVDSQGDVCDTNLFPESSNHEDEHRMEYSSHGDQSAQFSQKESSTTSRTQRGSNFTLEEDILLVSAWLNISSDAIQGNEQKHKTYWLRVWEYFHEHKNFISERSETSLMHRWSTIQLATNKFCACFAQIELRHHSGVPDKDQVLKALKIHIVIAIAVFRGLTVLFIYFQVFQAKVKYRELYGSSFPFEHCWNELRDQPKWKEDGKKRNKPKRNRCAFPHTSSPSTPDLINVGDVDASHDVILDVERPPSDKVEADLSNKQSSQDRENGCTSSPLAMLTHDSKEDEQKTNEKKMDKFEKTYLQEQERLALEQQRLTLEQLKEEERIMLMDTTGMPPHQAEYFRRRQMKILGK
ncbi:hypothetical protein RHMOL_Rhmol07G0079200 [Rhododendron molle]|uniref:Uncharacterized protein n=1 Tax=Rhododendron molle TaxID=49168 RepID=A0ACC0MZP7_RHOML|nr:hypothetical protein RHMOL_Rhmol07G0079200 [Rhododendron molle]